MKPIPLYTWSMVAVFSVLYALARFPGLESHSGYYGMAYAIIHPESFPGDINGRFHPAMISWYSIFVKLCGDIWLDDRFNILVYAVSVGITAFGVLRITRLLGINDILGQVAVLAILCGHHTFIGNVPHLVDAVCYRPSTYVYPVGIWLFYFVLKGASWQLIAFFSLLIVTASLKNGWFPAVCALLIAFKENIKWSWGKVAAYSFGILAAAMCSYGAWLMWQGKLAENAALFMDIMNTTENSEANPLMDGLGPYMYLVLLGIILSLRVSNEAIQKRLKAIWVISLILYVGGALYYSFAPDFIKVPFFLALAVSRSTWLTQILLFLVLSCILIQQLRRESVLKAWVAALGLIALYAVPVYEYLSLCDFFKTHQLVVSYQVAGRMKVFLAVLIVFCLCWALLRLFGQKLEWSKRATLRNLFLFALAVTLLASFVQRIRIRAEDLKTMAQHGILGGPRGGAKWIGVNEYLRYHTPITSRILAFDGPEMIPDTSLRIRSGRSMALSHEIAYYFNYQKRMLQKERYKMEEELSIAWRRCDMGQVKHFLPQLENPDYIIIPKDHVCAPSDIGFSLDTIIGNYAILKKEDQ